MFHKTIQLSELNQDIMLTTYFLDDSPELLNGESRPVVIVCPGGAYMMLSDREAEAIALRFNAMGYHAVVLRYSVLNKNLFQLMNEPDDVKKVEFDEKNNYPAPIRDIGRAMLWIHEHANEYYIDVNEIILCGFSAGGHNVLLYSTNWHKPVITEYFNESSDKFKPAATIAGYPLSDFVYMSTHINSFEMMEKKMFQFACKSYLGTEEPDKELLKSVSPALQVTDKTPPMFLWATSDDSLVPVQHSIFMVQSLAEKSIPFEVHIYEEGDHGLSLATQATAGAKTHVRPDVAKWIDAVELWLNKRVLLKIKEKRSWF